MKNLVAKIFRRLPVILASLAVASCVTPPPSHGNFTNVSEDVQKAIADEAVGQMARVFPPAKTKLVFLQKAEDIFGQTFVDGLRTNGYAVEDNVGDADAADKTLPAGAYTTAYTIDDIGDILRLTIQVGQRSITKAYLKKPDGSYGGSGYWSFKE